MLLPTLGEIFHKANHVMIWLGDATHDSDVAIQFLHFMRGMDLWSDGEDDQAKAADLVDCEEYLPRWNAVQSLFNRS